MSEQSDYDRGVKDGELNSLKQATAENTADIKLLNRAVFLLYGAIALVQFVLPLFEGKL